MDGNLTVVKVKRQDNTQMPLETNDANSQERTNDQSDSKDDSFSFQVVKNQPKTRIELVKAREPLISTEDLDDDEHFDDQITDSEQTDTEIQNNLVAFRLKDTAVLDSDVDSDAGNSSTRFSLPS